MPEPHRDTTTRVRARAREGHDMTADPRAEIFAAFLAVVKDGSAMDWGAAEMLSLIAAAFPDVSSAEMAAVAGEVKLALSGFAGAAHRLAQLEQDQARRARQNR